MKKFSLTFYMITWVFAINTLFGQSIFIHDMDPCFYDEQRVMQDLEILGPGWGYNYDSLLADLDRWSGSPYVRIDSAGASVQGRTLWTMEITDTLSSTIPRARISIHARTHPGEVQSSWVTNEIIDFLLSDSVLAQRFRATCIFNIMPMYNPDGVELGYGRENANGEDLERNWDNNPHEPETATLKSLFEKYMASDFPVRVALNMHSSSAGKRFFVYHHENGTSLEFTHEEKRYIGAVKSYWPEGIEDWDYSISWREGTPTHFPESWFWFNFRESVMALTYEDIYGTDNNVEFRRAARALLHGTYDFLFEDPQSIDFMVRNTVTEDFSILPNYPNPFNNQTRLRFNLPERTSVSITIFNAEGRSVFTDELGVRSRGYQEYIWSADGLSSGMYLVKITAGRSMRVSKVILLK